MIWFISDIMDVVFDLCTVDSGVGVFISGIKVQVEVRKKGYEDNKKSLRKFFLLSKNQSEIEPENEAETKQKINPKNESENQSENPCKHPPLPIVSDSSRKNMMRNIVEFT